MRVGDVDLPPDLVALTGGNLRMVGRLTQAGIESTRALLLIPLGQWVDPIGGKCFVPGCAALVGPLRELLAERWGVDLGALAPRPQRAVLGLVAGAMPLDEDPAEMLEAIRRRDAERDARGGAA